MRYVLNFCSNAAHNSMAIGIYSIIALDNNFAMRLNKGKYKKYIPLNDFVCEINLTLL